ncbi:MAG TPA: hypothetical protein VE046_14480 [Steroidobacteraceae bacterium]|nr:hypothetical protein [Steroidobacteraceae bacterium]
MNRKFCLALAVGALSVAGLSLAEEPTASPTSGDTTMTFSKLDADKDGKISASEATASQKVADQFVAADKNQDGYLDQSEFSAISK